MTTLADVQQSLQHGKNSEKSSVQYLFMVNN